MDGYIVTLEYESGKKFETADLVEAARMAVACAMHTGKRFTVRRLNDDPPGQPRETPLFSVGPTTFDYRRVTPGTILALKAMAHELVSNIDEVVPEIPMEGPPR